VQAAIAHDLSQFFDGSKGREVQDAIGYRNQPVPKQDMPLEQAEGAGSQAREESDIFSTKATLEREKKSEEHGFIKDENGVIINNEGYLDKAIRASKDAKNDINFLTGGASDCVTDQEVTINKTEEICDEYYDIKQNNCFARQIVEIDPKYSYLCSKKREVKEKHCIDALKSLICKQSSECAAGGVVPGSVESGMEWHSDKNTSTLRLGSLGTYYWRCGNNCKKVIRAAGFGIEHKDLIKVFKLKKLFLNNLLQISVNGTTVYNSLGGNKLEIQGWGEMAGIDAGLGKRGNCMINNGRQIPDYVDIDLIPYLKEGRNEIVIELVYSRDGHVHIEIEAKQHCCTEWVEEREETCTFS
jgi:hypothetical protein